jgi:hypothetical protein
MNIRNVVVLSSFALLTAGQFAHADASAKASDACIQAFVETYLPKDSAVRVRKVGATANPLEIYARKFTLDLSANAGGELVAVRCVANADGEVLALERAGET